MRDLPEGWEWARFDSVAMVDSNLVDPADHSDHPHIAPNHIESRTGKLLPYRTIREDGVTSGKHLFAPGHILYSKIRPYLAKAIRVDFAGLCSADMYPISTGLNPRYLLQWLLSTEFTELAAREQGRSVLPKINKEGLAKLPVPVPPLAAQERIVAAIEEHLSRLDAAADLVRAVIPRLAVLRSASIKSLVRPHWPMHPLGDLTINFDGRRVPLKRADRETRPGPYPYYGASGVIDSIDGYLFEGEFLLIAEDGANLATRSKPIAFPASGQFWVNNHAHVVQPVDGLDRRYLELVINASDIQRLITGSAQPKLTQANLNRIEVPVPPLQEQLALVSEHDRAASLAERIQVQLRHVDARGRSARRSVLAAAFSGQLVPHNPADEPASVLLDRIRAERAAATSTKRTQKAKAS